MGSQTMRRAKSTSNFSRRSSGVRSEKNPLSSVIRLQPAGTRPTPQTVATMALTQCATTRTALASFATASAGCYVELAHDAIVACSYHCGHAATDSRRQPAQRSPTEPRYLTPTTRFTRVNSSGAATAVNPSRATQSSAATVRQPFGKVRLVTLSRDGRRRVRPRVRRSIARGFVFVSSQEAI